MGRCVALLSAVAMQAHAYVPAGTPISSPVTLQYRNAGGQVVTQQAAPVVDVVDELIELELRSLETEPLVTAAGATNEVVRFQLTNQGNGAEPVQLRVENELSGNAFNPIFSAIYVDDGDGVFDAASDQLYAADHNEPVLGRLGTSSNVLTVFVLNDIPAQAQELEEGHTELIATSATGSGPVGTVFEGAGDEQTAAVIGWSEGRGADEAAYRVESARLSAYKSVLVFNASSPVLTEAVPGATLRYTIRAEVTGAGTLEDVTLTDVIPEGCSYTPDSLLLNGNPLSDLQDTDAGHFDAVANRIVVELGALKASDPEPVVIFETTMNKENL